MRHRWRWHEPHEREMEMHIEDHSLSDVEMKLDRIRPVKRRGRKVSGDYVL